MSGLGLERGFVHLNVDGRWSEFSRHGLELDEDGGLFLAALPLPSSPPDPALREVPPPDGPAGVVVTPNRILFFTDPDRHLLWRLAPCDRGTAPAPCAGGRGDEPGRFRHPRGMAHHPMRDALVVADSGNHRLQLLDAVDAQVRGVWGEAAGAARGPSGEPGRFNTPWAVAVDRDGYTYVVDHGNRRIQKLDLDGRPLDGFRRRVEDGRALSRPVDLAVADGDEGAEIHVLDGDSAAVVVLNADGELLRRLEGAAPGRAMGIAADRTGVYLGDNDRPGLRRLLPDGDPVGHASGYEGPVAALSLGGDERLWLHPGAGHVPLPFAPRGAHARRGVFWGGPFSVDEVAHEWHQLRALGTPPGTGTGIEFYVHLSDDPAADPGPPAGPAWAFPIENATDPAETWRRLPQRGFHGLVGGHSRYLRIGGRLVGDGGGTPRVEQLRIDYDSQTWLEYLPAIYRMDQASRRDLEALLTLSESIFRDVEDRSRELPSYFDPATTPAPWLDWLADWLALKLPEGWSEIRKREAIGGAFHAYGAAGTRIGMKESIRLHTGLPTVIEEPIRSASWWLLPDVESTGSGKGSCGCAGRDDGGETVGSCCGGDACGEVETEVRASRLGMSTVLAPAQPDGAIVGSTAVADRSHLTDGAEYGAPLFDDVAYRFTVSLYQGPGLTEQRLAEVRRVVDREKPGHTDYEICTIQPRMRVGYQAILGVDTVVSPAGADDRSSRAGGWAPHGDGEHGKAGLRLRGEPTGVLGVRSEVGKTARLR